VVVTIAPASTNSIFATNAIAGVKPAVGTNIIAGTNTALASSNSPPAKPKFTKQQVAGRLKQLKLLFEEGMLTDEFYNAKVAECEAAE
jgi:hypothetical protein